MTVHTLRKHHGRPKIMYCMHKVQRSDNEVQHSCVNYMIFLIMLMGWLPGLWPSGPLQFACFPCVCMDFLPQTQQFQPDLRHVSPRIDFSSLWNCD